MQNLEIIGNLTADPELREADGKAVCNFTVACDTFLGENRKRTDYFRVTAWRKLAESCFKHLKKGWSAAVVGDVTCHAYMSRNGEPMACMDVKADKVKFLGAPAAEYDDLPL